MSSGSWFELPTGGRLEEGPTIIHVLPKATPKALEIARRTWPEANADDFERAGKVWSTRRRARLTSACLGTRSSEPIRKRRRAGSSPATACSSSCARPTRPTRSYASSSARCGAPG
jgi:hypothetical protein